MAVTEIALLRLKSTDPSPTTKTSLLQAQKAQTEYSGYPLHFFGQVEDPSFVYIIGGWESVAKHNGDWIPSETNQKLLGQLKDDVDVKWMFHLDIEPSTSMSTIPIHAPVLAISRYLVDTSKKAEFENAFTAGMPYLGADITPFTYCGGWRIDKEGEDEEFVLFSGLDKVEDYFGFKESEAVKGFKKIKNALKGEETKHIRLEKWE